MFRILAVTALTAALLLSCGSSFRRTYQSDNAFLRCFDMDYNPAKGIEAKKTCWETWLEDHLYNQPEDKVKYAWLRLEEIDAGVNVPGPPGPEGAFHERPQATEDPKGAPVKHKFELAPHEDAGVSSDAGLDDLPGQNCEMICKNAHKSCVDICGEKTEPCTEPCTEGYKACMRSCFK